MLTLLQHTFVNFAIILLAFIVWNEALKSYDDLR